MWRPTRHFLAADSRTLFVAKRSCSGKQTRNATVKPFREMPGPSSLQNMIKYSWKSMDSFHRDIVEGFEKYGPLYKFNLPGFKMVFACDPKDIEHVFRNEDKHIIRGPTSLFAEYFLHKGMQGGISGDDESWYKHRTTAAPNMLLPIRNKGYIPGLCKVADDSIASLKEGRNVNVLQLLQLWATESILYVMYGHRAGTNAKTPDKKSLEFTQAVFDAFKIEGELVIGFPFHKYFTTPSMKKFIAAGDIISNFTFEFMKKIENAPSSLPTGYECLFEKFRKEKKLTDEEINQIAFTLIAGGVDTSSIMLVSTLSMLSKSQRAQAKLYEEIHSVLPNGEKPTYKHINKMPYLKATINEVFRTNPVTVGTTRLLSKPLVLGGYEIPPGVIVAVSSMKSTSMATQLYSDVEDFRPERWLRGSKSIHPFAMLPFGFGPRMCTGRRVAVMEISLFLVRLLQKFKVEENNLPEDQLDWKFGVVLHPDRPLNVYLTPR